MRALRGSGWRTAEPYVVCSLCVGPAENHVASHQHPERIALANRNSRLGLARLGVESPDRACAESLAEAAGRLLHGVVPVDAAIGRPRGEHRACGDRGYEYSRAPGLSEVAINQVLEARISFRVRAGHPGNRNVPA